MDIPEEMASVTPRNAASEYIPLTENVRLGYSYRPNLPKGKRHHAPLLEEFDLWLAKHDLAVRAALLTEVREGVEAETYDITGLAGHQHKTSYNEGIDDALAVLDQVSRSWLVRPPEN